MNFGACLAKRGEGVSYQCKDIIQAHNLPKRQALLEANAIDIYLAVYLAENYRPRRAEFIKHIKISGILNKKDLLRLNGQSTWLHLPEDY